MRNLAKDPAYKPLLDDMVAQLRELEKERMGPVKFPFYGGASLDQAIRPDPIGRPVTPLDQINTGPSPIAGIPGAYVQLPFGDLHIERSVYEDRGIEHLPQTADESRTMAEARARTRAAMLCELTPTLAPPGKGR